MAQLRPVERQGRLMMMLSLHNVVVFTGAFFAPPFWAFVALIFLWGLGAGANMALNRGMVQSAAPPAYRARVMSVLQLSQMAGGLMSVSSAPQGWDTYMDPGTGMVSASFPKGWTINPVARGVPGMWIEFAQVQITSPDGYHFIEGLTQAQAGGADAPDVHPGTAANGLEPLEDRNVSGCVVGHRF